MKKSEVRYESYHAEDAEIVVVAFGTVARIALTSVMKLRRKGFKVGLFRPITLFPFPEKEIAALADSKRCFIAVEMNAGQMVEDVRLSVNGRSKVHFYGRTGGVIITPEEINNEIVKLIKHQLHFVKN